MTPLVMAALCLVMVATSFLSGLFGMAGGMILIGILLTMLPVPTAMVLHAVTQMASNGWRGLLWHRYVRWKPAAAYITGCALAVAAWSFTGYVPNTALALILLGVTPFIVRFAPSAALRPDPTNPINGVCYGTVCMALILLTGVAGPLVDSFFLGGNFDRREIVATKAVCQIVGHALKLVYFGGMIAQAATLDPTLAILAVVASMLGTTLARRFLEAMSDVQYRVWANQIITTISGYYVLYGTSLLFAQS